MSDVIRRRNLPHWDVPGAAYFVTTCLEGSIPAQGRLDIRGYRDELARRPIPPDAVESDVRRDRWKLAFARIDRWLDDAHGIRWLADPDLARQVVDALYFFAGQRYDLLGFVVMPSHFHWVFQPLPAWYETLDPKFSARGHICKSVNQKTARDGNRRLKRTGDFWQHESYDHWIRDVDELERILLYIEANPVKAGLVKSPEDWPFSSAYDRKKRGLYLGEPLLRGGELPGLPSSDVPNA
jgi:putative transposase